MSELNKEILQKLTVKELKDKCREMKLTKFSTLKKEDLVQLVYNKLYSSVSDEIVYSEPNVVSVVKEHREEDLTKLQKKQLIEICKEMGVKKYLSMNKKGLIDLINKEKQNKKQNTNVVKEEMPVIEDIYVNEVAFINQIYRKDILTNMLSNTNLTGQYLFNLLLKEHDKTIQERRYGWIFESICQILIVLKCIENINYTEIYDGTIENLKLLKSFNDLLKIKVDGGGNNIIDMAIKQETTFLLFSIKYRNKYGETDVSKIDNTVKTQCIVNDYKISLIVKDKNLILSHKYKNKKNIDKQLHDKVIEDGLLFDENDIIKALNVFCQKFSKNTLTTDEFIDFINAEYLQSPRKLLVKKLHQKMTEIKFINSLHTQKYNMWCIAHKPRSGKSITILSICKYLLETRCKKILIMTSVPATINSFIKDLEKYIDFKYISYKLQEEFNTLDDTFIGIVFCSVQYLKMDGKSKKKDILKKIGFDVIVTDEAHQGSSTDKTKTEILDVDSDVEEIRKNIKLNIFATGTAEKTKKYYRIHNSCVYEWEVEDEAYMKELIKPFVNNRESIIEYMCNRHGNTFTECLENETLNIDYTKHPTQVLMKHMVPQLLIDEINTYNTKYGTNYGYSCSSLFALKQNINAKGVIEYAEEFELCKTSDGIEILKGFFECIISKNKMNNKTIMKQIEMTQTSNNSRKSTSNNPLLFIMYLPTHTRNNTISSLQKTLKQFLFDYDLWSEYNIEYSNSLEDTGNIKEEYDEYIQTIMNKTKQENKKGCILLLGNKGSVGITYNECDVTIHLDDGHNLDNQKQRMSRALTEAEGKTIGINVDMNIQRTYMYLMDVIQRHRKNKKTTKTNAEILYYLFEHNVFLFDPQHIKNGKMKTAEIMAYYQKEADNLMKQIDDTPFLENLVCDDDMREFIKMDFKKNNTNNVNAKINPDLEGEQKDCPKGDKTKTEIDGPVVSEENDIPLNEEENKKIEILINQTYEMCKSFLFPLLALISRSYKIFDFKEIFICEKTKGLIIELLKNKKIELNTLDNYNIIVNIMNNIIDNNSEIVNNIREIYSVAPANRLRELIAKHFIPTQDEKKNNAEVPTPVKLVDEMLATVPVEFWKKPQKVFEPCCGKGNFVLGIFDKFYEGLREMYPDEMERCCVIMTDCIYYADLTALNVFITTEIMKCEVQSRCGLEELDYEFNCYVGDTLKLNVYSIWKINNFDAVIGNPPYQPPSNDKKGGTSIWNEFVSLSLSKLLKEGGYLVFVHPALWRKPDNKLRDEMFSKQIHYLSIHSDSDGNKMFGATTRFDYYLLENTLTYKNTRVIFEDKKEFDILITKELPFIPNFGWSIFDKVFKKLNNNGIMVIGDSDCHTSRPYVSKIKTNEYKYEILNSISKTKGKTFCYSSKPHKVQHNKKVLFSNGRHIVPFYDNGELGITQGGLYILVNDENEGNKLVEYLNSKLVVYLMKATKWSNFETCKQLFWYIPLPTNISEINDNNVNAYFNLIPEEIMTINK